MSLLAEAPESLPALDAARAMVAPTAIITAPEADWEGKQQHGWYPRSVCGSGCVDSPGLPVNWLLVAVRLVRLIAVAVAAVVLGALVAPLPRIARRAYIRRTALAILHAIGIRLEVEDHRPFGSRTRGLVVSNHVSYLDILAIAGVHPARFVAKSDVADIPGAALLARRLGVIFIDRGSLRRLPAVVHTARASLEEDASVAVFPEGTTWCGRDGGRFRPAFFQSALDAGVPVVPIGVRFTASGIQTTAPVFIGDDTPLDTLRRVLALRDVAVHIRLHEPQMPRGNRRDLAARCESLIRGGDPELSRR